MTNKSAVVYPVVLSFIVAFVPGIFSACTSDRSGLGQTLGDAKAPDGMVRTGGAAGGGALRTGGIVASGGSVNGGAPRTGGLANGGAPATGGVGTGGIRTTGGTATGGRIGTGGIASGGIVKTGGAGGLSTGGIHLDAGTEVSLPTPDTREAGATCAQLTTQTACDDRNDCHAVFVDQQTCGCATPGCCMRFSRCATGGQAKCTGEALCEMATPMCEGPYVLAYTGSCYEGCVRQTACAGNDGGGPAMDAPLPVDTAPDFPALWPCNPMACKSGELPVRISSLPINQCTCDPNPCGATFPSCLCAGDICTKYNATCAGYAPGSGYLLCTLR